MKSPTLGLWIDDAPSVVLGKTYLPRFIELGFRTAAVMVESMSSGFDPKYSRAHLEALGERCRELDIELVLTVWPEPRAVYLAEMVERLPPLLKASGAAALEFDTESNWIPKRLQGFRSMEEASEGLLQVVRKFWDLDIRSELTTFPMHAENGRSAVLADDVDRILPQAYSVRNRRDNAGKPIQIAWGDTFGPGGMQRFTLDRALQVPRKPNGKPRLSVGLAAYDQRWPGRSGELAMRTAYEAALEYDPVEVRWWSSKWVIGAKRLSYTAPFFRNLAKRR